MSGGCQYSRVLTLLRLFQFYKSLLEVYARPTAVLLVALTAVSPLVAVFDVTLFLFLGNPGKIPACSHVRQRRGPRHRNRTRRRNVTTQEGDHKQLQVLHFGRRRRCSGCLGRSVNASVQTSTPSLTLPVNPRPPIRSHQDSHADSTCWYLYRRRGCRQADSCKGWFARVSCLSFAPYAAHAQHLTF